MTIDKSGRWWKGTAFEDVAEYLRGYTADAYPAGPVVQSICACGHTLFGLDGDADEGCARRTCASCKQTAFIADSGEYWEDAEPKRLTCRVCRGRVFEVGVAFSLRDDGEVRWITVGHRCVRCNVLGSFVDWKIDYVPSTQLIEQA